MHTSHGLVQRAVFIQAIRRFFIDRGYLEVDTPVRIPAPAPEAYIEPEPADGWFLQTSPELCMKRLLAQGFPKIFQICKCFRRSERGHRHLPEFTMLEWYRTGIDYLDLMEECEELFRFLDQKINAGRGIEEDGRIIPLTSPWERLRVEDAFGMYADMSVQDALDRDQFDKVLTARIEPKLGMKRPVFLYDYPARLGALARVKENDPQVAERFEIYISGMELANGFSELTDADEQRSRFAREREKISALGRDPGPMPEKFLDALAAMPEASGIALGVDRLAMLFSGAKKIDDVVSFTPEAL
ncbi:MAG: EF-P lysine aminoacylase GenX [Desulfobulbaceae bacterium]|nr:EF-P lysine aminoacylase GenX [Desulfobulbaceae bacterium]